MTELLNELYTNIDETVVEVILPMSKYYELELDTQQQEYNMWALSKPRPPVSEVSYGWLSSSTKYDHHAPEYLAKSQMWEAKSPSFLDGKERDLIFNTIHGAVKITKGTEDGEIVYVRKT